MAITEIKIVHYEAKFKNAFRDLNKAWIEQYFKMEATDYKYLDFPEENIINKGGYILIALHKEIVAGVCALVKMEHSKYDYELSKMAVSPDFQGKGIGYLLGQAIIEKAQSLSAQNLYLESNTILAPAINLYKKLGFQEIFGEKSPYERSNIQMVLVF